MAISFDESNDYYTIADHASLTMQNGDWCVGIWTKVDDNTGTDYQYVLSNNAYSVNNSFNLLLDEASEGGTPDQWELISEDGDGTPVNLASTSAPGADGKWRLVICQRDTADNEIQMWFCEFGGTAVKEASGADTDFAAIDGGLWNIGRRVDGQAARYWGSIACEFFKGDFALSQEEIEALGSGRPIHSLGRVPDVYLPMHTAEATLMDLFGGNNATRQDTPVTVEHAPVSAVAGAVIVVQAASSFTEALVGILTSSGTLVSVKKVFKSLAGALSSSGTLDKKALKSLVGALTSSGNLVEKTLKDLVGTLTSGGTVIAQGRFVQSVIGTLTSSGIVATIGKFVQSVAGMLTSSGTLIKKSLKSLAGVVTSSGIVATVSSVVALLVSSFIRAVQSDWFLPVSAYDTFTRADGALGNTELVGPDGQSISGLAWVNRVGTTLVSSNTASASALVGGIAIATVTGTISNIWVSAPLTRSGGNIGIIVRYADTTNYVIAYHDGTNVHLDKVVGGVTTSVINIVSAYAAGRVIKLVCDGTAFRLYYNDLLIGTDVISDAGVQNGVEYGLYSTNVGNSQADIVILPRGTGDEYSALDTWGN